MRKLLIVTLISVISGCSTVAGTVKGLGEDVKSGTDAVAGWIKPSGAKQ